MVDRHSVRFQLVLAGWIKSIKYLHTNDLWKLCDDDRKIESRYNYLRLTLIKVSWTRSLEVLWTERKFHTLNEASRINWGEEVQVAHAVDDDGAARVVDWGQLLTGKQRVDVIKWAFGVSSRAKKRRSTEYEGG